ncbi:hypothetical protein [Pseudoroseomonas cervicalis]|uniref:hypothetical protein n=1 Tax=Teichococcus cervicalis TaxID=204525 RepID=UPI00277EE4D5|nr:hypothetical protein [Pseudoroseomonas cervicalis]MDQ1079404.1 hypothetical protein [Pseudoroseomonas cervicalis]
MSSELDRLQRDLAADPALAAWLRAEWAAAPSLAALSARLRGRGYDLPETLLAAPEGLSQGELDGVAGGTRGASSGGIRPLF